MGRLGTIPHFPAWTLTYCILPHHSRSLTPPKCWEEHREFQKPENENKNQGLISLFPESLSTALSWRGPCWASLPVHGPWWCSGSLPPKGLFYPTISLSLQRATFQTSMLGRYWRCPSLPFWKVTNLPSFGMGPSYPELYFFFFRLRN